MFGKTLPRSCCDTRRPKTVSQIGLKLQALPSVDHVCVHAELLVVAKSEVNRLVEILQERDPRVHFQVDVPRQPDFIIDERLLYCEPRPLVQSRQKPTERDRIRELSLE